MLFLLNRLVGMNGIVWSQFVADALNVALCFAVYRRYARRAFPGGGSNKLVKEKTV